MGGHLKEFDALPLYLSDLGLGQDEVVSATETDSVVSVLKKMNEAGVSALPLVDSEGRLSGNFSATDLVGLYKEHLPSFSHAIKGYLKEHSEESLVSEGLPQQSTTLKDVFNFFNEHN